jgi:hypothetical protein
MGRSNEALIDNTVAKEMHEGHPEDDTERPRRLEMSLERGLEGTFPASDPINVVQPPPSVLDQKKSD